jgi:hypothetical protein
MSSVRPLEPRSSRVEKKKKAAIGSIAAGKELNFHSPVSAANERDSHARL